MIEDAFVIIVDHGTPTQLNYVHEVIKQHTKNWWHRFSSTWIVSGKTASEWRDIVRPFIEKSSKASALVIALPSDDTERAWSYFGIEVEDRCAWLFQQYAE
jgi:hypothetical protein